MSILGVHDFRKGYRDIFVDTEFLEVPGEKTQLISVAMVERYNEDVVNYVYMVSNEFDMELAKKHKFVGPNVLPHLGIEPEGWASEEQIRNQLRLWVNGPRYPAGGVYPRFWAWFSGLDFAVLHNLFGGIDGWPQEWPMSIADLAQLKWLIAPRMKLKSEYEIEYPDGTDGSVAHNALYDALQLEAKFRHFCEKLEKKVIAPGPVEDPGVQ
jgi:hypothetical protein